MSWLESLGLLGLFLGTFLAATIVLFSSDALYVAVFMSTHNPVGCLVVGTLGNWLGSVTTYWIGRIGRWEWIERWFKVSPEAMERQKKKVDRYGIWLALLAWVPFIGDVFTLALGFSKPSPWEPYFCSSSASSSVSSFGTLLSGRCNFEKELNTINRSHRLTTSNLRFPSSCTSPCRDDMAASSIARSDDEGCSPLAV